jgi:hypothetical protein
MAKLLAEMQQEEFHSGRCFVKWRAGIRPVSRYESDKGGKGGNQNRVLMLQRIEGPA